MGSFNTKCFVSNQTISTDDKVLLFPIRSQQCYGYSPLEVERVQLGCQRNTAEATIEKILRPTDQSLCYANAWWAPVSAPIEAVYDDYGRFELEHTPTNYEAVVSLLDYWYKVLVKVLPGENTAHDIGFDFREHWTHTSKRDDSPSWDEIDKVWSTVSDVLHEGRLFGYSPFRGEDVQQYAVSVMSKHTADYLVNRAAELQQEERDYFERRGEPLPLWMDPAAQIRVELKMIQRRLRELPEESSPVKAAVALAELRMNQLHRAFNERVDNVESTEPREVILLGIMHAFTSGGMSVEIAAEGLIAEREYRAKALTIIGMLNNWHLYFVPQFYAGQDYSNEIGSEILKLTQTVHDKIITDIKTRYPDNEDYDEDEDHDE